MNSLKPVIGVSDSEWIVIDGGSNIEIGEQSVKDQVRNMADHFTSESDDGIYDAMNKGTQHVSGDYVLYLNAGDELHPYFDLAWLSQMPAGTTPDMVWGQCEVRYQDGTQLQVKSRSPSWAWYCMPVFHPAIFFRREILGGKPYDTSYLYAADYDLVCRLLASDARVMQSEALVSVYRRGGISDTQGDAAREEENIIRLKYFRIPAFIGYSVKKFKEINARQSTFSKMVRWFRRWI